jgi:hypothetical protein
VEGQRRYGVQVAKEIQKEYVWIYSTVLCIVW